MALPPSIPTSFVPKQPVTSPRKRTSGANPFLALSYLVVIVALIGATGVFGYDYYLQGVAAKKAKDVAAAQHQIDQATVTEFIRLRDRFTAAKDILNNHIALSQLFDDLETLTLQGVQFHSLKIAVATDRKGTLSMDGTARTFNTLAAQSAAFASDKRIKRAIFSGINIKGGLVTFTLNADIDPTLILGAAGSNPAVQAPAAPASVPLPGKSATSSVTNTTP
ncbi:MAG: putative pilN [Parcubacteria group bacterium]|nr:putative pilN [Parcubacteria group bacterium]